VRSDRPSKQSGALTGAIGSFKRGMPKLAGIEHVAKSRREVLARQARSQKSQPWHRGEMVTFGKAKSLSEWRLACGVGVENEISSAKRYGDLAGYSEIKC